MFKCFTCGRFQLFKVVKWVTGFLRTWSTVSELNNSSNVIYEVKLISTACNSQLYLWLSMAFRQTMNSAKIYDLNSICPKVWFIRGYKSAMISKPLVRFCIFCCIPFSLPFLSTTDFIEKNGDLYRRLTIKRV